MLLVPFLLSAAAASPALCERADGRFVKISNGQVIGEAVRGPNQAIVNRFLGIPFAKNPPLRFAPPEPAPPWTTPLFATSRAPACIQQFVGGPGSPLSENVQKVFNNPQGVRPAESEDCLYINVYAPADASPSNLKPVMFWIFGGNLMFGTGALDFYDGVPFAAVQDVVLVSFNYRTSIFGFPNSPQIPPDQRNPGFLDQRMALRWVQENIAQFGGDPRRVLLFGESAGGYSVKQLLANPPRPLPFSAAILQSQQVFAPLNGTDSWMRAAKKFACPDFDQLNCLRRVDARALADFIGLDIAFFGPEQNGITSTADVRPSILSGTFAKVPLLFGTTANEFRVFQSLLGLQDSKSFADFLIDSLRLKRPASLAIRAAIAKLFRGAVADSYEVVDRLGTDLFFTCPTSSLSNFLATNGHDVWRYGYAGVHPNLATFTAHPRQGAYHTSEIPLVFGTLKPDSSGEQRRLSVRMQDVWAGFAKGTLPNWPRLSPDKPPLANVFGDAQGYAVESTAKITDLDGNCLVLNPVGELLQSQW